MRDLNWDLLQLQRRAGGDGSHATRRDRSYVLARAADTLHELGFKGLRATGLKRKHVNALVAEWQRRGLAAGTIKNRTAHIRWWAKRVGRPGVVPANGELGIANRVYVTGEDKSAVLEPRTFCELARLGTNMTQVAERLKRTQPWVSAQMRQLEAAVGARLLERRRQGLVPTALGRRLQHLAAPLVEGVDRGEHRKGGVASIHGSSVVSDRFSVFTHSFTNSRSRDCGSSKKRSSSTLACQEPSEKRHTERTKRPEMTEQFLMTYAVRKPFARMGVVPKDAEYDASKGYWVKSRIPLVKSQEFTEAGVTHEQVQPRQRSRAPHFSAGAENTANASHRPRWCATWRTVSPVGYG